VTRAQPGSSSKPEVVTVTHWQTAAGRDCWTTGRVTVSGNLKFMITGTSHKFGLEAAARVVQCILGTVAP